MTELKDFVKQEARPLPVILLLDTSGSMYGEKINALNNAVKEMISTFGNEESTRAEIHIAVVTFGGSANLHTPIKVARSVEFQEMKADGYTPLGAAFEITKNLIEDKSQISSRAYRPSVILVSDGQPNDPGWESKMQSFINEGRTKKCDRWALGIGADADETMLKNYLNDSEKKVFHAEDASEIVKFFRYVTMSTTQRSQSANPNKAKISSNIPDLKDPFDDKFDF